MTERERILEQINQLKAFKSVANTPEGRALILFIFKISNMDEDPLEAQKNSGLTAHALGKQSVGRQLLDKLIQADVDIDSIIFSKKKPNKIHELETELKNIIEKGEDYE